MIQAFSGTLKKNRDVEDLAPYPARLSEHLEERLAQQLQAMKLSAVDVARASLQEGESLSLLTEKSALLSEGGDGDEAAQSADSSNRSVSWSPPTPNWNPWLGCNIDEGPLASASLESISQDLLRDWSDRRKSNEFMAQQRQRDKLPIYAMRDEIMGSINENPVVLIRGSTGCGKTTQVRE